MSSALAVLQGRTLGDQRSPRRGDLQSLAVQLTEAETALRESEFNHAQAVFDYLMSRRGLDAALGTVPVAAGELAVRVKARGES